MFKHKKIIILVLLFLSLSSILYIFLSTKRAPSPPPVSPSPAPISALRVVNFIPQPGEHQLTFPNTAITMVFNQALLPDSLSLAITPQMILSPKIDDADPKILYIKPQTNWKVNTLYKITLTVEPLNGLPLEKPVEYLFTPLVPQDQPDVF